MKKFDIVVVGGSVAGSTAAYLLGRSGRSVALVDPRKLQRPRACGEGLSSLGISLLEQAGLWGRTLETNSLPFYGYKLHLMGGGSLRLAPGEGKRMEGRGIQRKILDNELFESAKSVSDCFRCRVVGFKSRGALWEIDTEGEAFSAKEIVLAWGAGHRLRQFESKESFPRSGRRYGFVIWFEGDWRAESDGFIHAYRRDGIQFLTTPVANSVLNVSILIDKHPVRSWLKEDLICHAAKIVEAQGFAIRKIIDTAGSAEIQSSRMTNFVPGAYCIGDALERFDPIGGMGMTHALSSATYISQTLNRKFERGTDWEETHREYLHSYRRQSWYYRNLTRLNFAAAATMNPNLIKALARFPRLSSTILGLGKELSHRNCMELVNQ